MQKLTWKPQLAAPPDPLTLKFFALAFFTPLGILLAALSSHTLLLLLGIFFILVPPVIIFFEIIDDLE